MSKTFPASQTKLAELRTKGIFPRSVVFQRSIRFLTLVILLFAFLSSPFSEKDLKIFFQNPEIAPSITLFIKIFTKYASIAILLLTLPLLIGLFQSKFYFSPSLAQPSFSRFKLINPFREVSFVSLHLIYFFILFLCAGLYFYSQLKIPCLPFEAKATYLEQINKSFIDFKNTQSKMAFRLSGMLLLCGLISLFTSWWFFKKEHMMSREELEAEQREQQVSSQYRQVMRDRGTSDG